jgi:hypothetical protein
MADEPENQTLHLLRGIRETLDQHSSVLADLSKRLNHMDEQVGDLKLQFTYTLGLAAGADFKAQTATRDAADTDRRMDELTARIEQLEKTR